MKRSIALALLAYFACLGTAAAQCSAELTISPPMMFTDGSTLDPAADLSGYGVYVDGARHDTITDPAVTTYVIGDLAADGASHDFNVTAIAADSGIESALSNAVTNTCPDERVPGAPTLIDVVIAWLKNLWARVFA